MSKQKKMLWDATMKNTPREKEIKEDDDSGIENGKEKIQRGSKRDFLWGFSGKNQCNMNHMNYVRKYFREVI